MSYTPVIYTYALASLDQVKLARNIPSTYTGSDNALIQSINQATDLIEHLLNRHIVARDYNEWIPVANEYIITREWPVNQVYEVLFGNTSALSVQFNPSNISNYIRATVESQDGTALNLRTIDINGVVNTTTLPFTTYGSTQALAGAINNLTGWVSVLKTNNPSVELKPTAAQNCMLPYNPTLNTVSTEVIEYSLYKESGQLGINYIMPVIEWLPLLVKYNAGYTTVPASLNELCISVALNIFDWLKLNMTLKSQTEGDYSVSYRDIYPESAAMGGLTPQQYGILNAYKTFAVGRTA